MSPKVNGKEIGSVGFGLMSLGLKGMQSPGTKFEEEAFVTLRAALASGCNLWNGGEFYGPPDNNSLTLLKKYFDKYPDDAHKVVLNVKGGFDIKAHTPDGSSAGVERSILNCIEMLGPQGHIAMFECARKDPNVPLKETLGTLVEMVNAGKIGGVALSEVSAKTIREAATITKILAVEIEFSLSHTEPLTNGVAKACAELGIPIHAYSPLGRGLLTGEIKSVDDLSEKDIRRNYPRFQPENLEVNLQLVKALEKFANKKGCLPPQLALGWLLTLSKQDGMPEIIPIPGTTSPERVKENSVQILLDDEEMKEIEEILVSHKVIGDRYYGAGMKYVNG